MDKIKIGVFGAGRGRVMIDTVAGYPDAELVAICDKYEYLLDRCAEMAEEKGLNVTMYTDFDKFIEHDMDAVILANYAHEHAPYAIRCLKKGMHVATEVQPCKNLAEAVELCEAVEESGKIFAYLENYCYFRATSEMRKLYREGKLGEFVHGEGEYIHDCEGIWRDITYGEKNHWRNCFNSTFYNTHSFGPIVHITGLRPVRVIGIENKPTERMQKLGYRAAEGAMEIIQMENGAMVKSIHGYMKREPAAIWYSIYGKDAMAESDRWDENLHTVHVYDDRISKQHVTYVPEPIVETDLAAHTLGHGGSDFYPIHYFVEAMMGKKDGLDNIIDVYSALDMAIPGILAYKSICNHNQPYDVPNFRNKEEREAYRHDYWCTWGEGKYHAPITGKGDYEIPDEVYDKVRKEWLEAQEWQKQEDEKARREQEKSMGR